jgi:hypothetical protein
MASPFFEVWFLPILYSKAGFIISDKTFEMVFVRIGKKIRGDDK